MHSRNLFLRVVAELRNLLSLCDTAVTQHFPTAAEPTPHIVMRYEKICLSDPKVFLRDDKRIGVIQKQHCYFCQIDIGPRLTFNTWSVEYRGPNAHFSSSL